MNAPVRRQPVVIGARYGLLVVLDEVERDANRNRRWFAVCDCGNRKIVRDDLLRGNLTGSCGCSRRVPLGPRIKPPPAQPFDKVERDDPSTPRTVTLTLTPEDTTVLRALALVDAQDPNDPAGTLLHLVRQAARSRGLRHVVGQSDPRARRAVQSAAQVKEQARAGLTARQRTRPSKSERAAFRAAEIEAGA